MSVSLIVAYAHNHVIGNAGKIPWDLPDDREHFKQLTLGSIVVMGRRTFEEIYKKFGAGLPGRETIVISSSKNYEGTNYHTVNNLEKALEYAQSLFPQKELFICGGEAVYKEAIESRLVKKMYITEIDADIPGDAFFPDFDKKDFELKDKTKIESPIPHFFLEYQRLF